MARRRYPHCVPREGSARLRALEDVVALPRKSPIASELGRALTAASSLHGVRSDLEPVPLRPTATTSEAGLLDQLATLQRADDPFVWPGETFEPVALEVERVFERLGLTQLALPIAA